MSNTTKPATDARHLDAIRGAIEAAEYAERATRAAVHALDDLAAGKSDKAAATAAWFRLLAQKMREAQARAVHVTDRLTTALTRAADEGGAR